MAKAIATKIPDVKLIEHRIFGDNRGFFYESYNAHALSMALGIDPLFVQDNHSRSIRGVLRGLHYQIANPQGKLVRVIAGSVYDVAVDMRKSSPTFGQWVGVFLDDQNRHSFWVPAGCAHGFLVLSEYAEFLYKTTDFYNPAAERTLDYKDPTLAIEWPLDGLTVQLSAKDSVGSSWQDAEYYP